MEKKNTYAAFALVLAATVFTAGCKKENKYAENDNQGTMYADRTSNSSGSMAGNTTSYTETTSTSTMPPAGSASNVRGNAQGTGAGSRSTSGSR
jgi:hypothetical protein